jgi:micrococcal nuclease
MYSYRCVITRVIDGDTVEAEIDLGFSTFLRTPVRLAGINTPELTGGTKEAGHAARSYLLSLITNEGPGAEWHVVTKLNKERDKYGRVLGVFQRGNLDLSQEMLKANHAVPYNG